MFETKNLNDYQLYYLKIMMNNKIKTYVMTHIYYISFFDVSAKSIEIHTATD